MSVVDRLQRIGLVTATLLVGLSIPGYGQTLQSVNNRLVTSSVLSDTSPASDSRKVEADRLFQQGIEQFYEVKDGQFQQQPAVESWEKALAIYRQIGDRRSTSATLVQLSYGYYALARYQKAIEAIQEPFEQVRKTGDRELEAVYLSAIGDAYQALKQYQQAIEHYQRQLAIVQQAGDRKREAQVLGNLVTTYRRLGQKQQAMSFQQQLTAVEQQLVRQAEAQNLFEEGFKQFQSGQLPSASQSWQQAQVIYREIQDNPGEAKFLSHLGEIYRYWGQYQQAIQYHQQALEIARRIRYRGDEADFLVNLGTVYIYLKQPQQAIPLFEQAREIYWQIGNRTAEAKSLTSSGIAYDLLGKPQEAMQFHQQALAIASLFGGRAVEANFRHELGLAYHLLGKYQRAIQFLEQGLDIYQQLRESHREGKSYRVEDLTAESNSLTALGAAYQSLGQYEQAIESHRQALAIAQQFEGSGFVLNALRGLGNAYYSLRQYQKAIEFYQQGLEITKSRDFRAVYLNDLGSAYHALGQDQQAIQSFQEALKIGQETGDRRKEAQSLDNLGIAYRSLAQYQQAIQFHQQSLKIAQQILDPLAEAQSLDHLGTALLAANEPAKAETPLRESLQVYESLRTNLKDTDKVSIFDTQRSAYNTLQQVLIAQNKTIDALEIAERGRARAFVDLLAQRLLSNPNNQASIKSLTIQQIQQIAKVQKATLVEYSIIGNQTLYIWVVKQTGQVVFKQVDLKSQNLLLEDLVTNSRNSLGIRGRGLGVMARMNTPSQGKQLQQLYQLLIEPIAQNLPSDPNERVIFIPQDSLFLVPFAALQDENENYLIEKHTILIAPAIQVLDLTRQQRQHSSGKSIVVVGNPTMPSIGNPPQPLPPLPGAEREALAIAQLLNTKAITGNQATKAAILQRFSNARIIHLATHGLLDDFKEQGVPGAIALAPSSNDNGLLTSSEILDLKLNAELIVLSACDTGRGRITGDGVIGLSRSLISAGVPSVIVSLWSVPDAPTASLMTEFYRQLQQNLDKAQALRQAILMTMKQNPDPKDWAAFTLIGEAE